MTTSSTRYYIPKPRRTEMMYRSRAPSRQPRHHLEIHREISARTSRNRIARERSVVAIVANRSDDRHAARSLPMMIFEKMPTAAKVMLLAMFHRRDEFRSRGMIHLMSYSIASSATTARDCVERTAARRCSLQRSGNGFPARDRPVFRNAQQPSSCASQRHVSRRGSRGPGRHAERRRRRPSRPDRDTSVIRAESRDSPTPSDAFETPGL